MAEAARIWLTRPQEDSVILAAELARQGIETIVAPVMRIVPRLKPEILPEKLDALLLTSRHAAAMLAHLPEDWRALPVFCVGAATGAVARDAAFTNITQGTSDVLDLLPSIADALPANSRVLYLAGAETRVDVAALLAVKNIHVETLIAYDAYPETELSAEIVAALMTGTLDGVVFFSPRSAQVAAKLLGSHSVGNVDAFCLSLAVAQAAGALAWRSIVACHSPTVESMLNLIVSRSSANLL